MQHRETEQILERFTGGVSYRYEPQIPLSEIHLTDADRQNIRPRGMDTEKIDQYATAMSNGDEFPALALYPVKKGGFEVLGGMHRFSAARKVGREFFDAYVVDLDEQRDERTIEILQRMLNMFHGSGYTKDERALHGMRLVALGYSFDDSAKMVALSPTTLRSKQDAIEARKRAANLQVAPPTSEVILVEFGRIRNDDLFKATIEVATSARLNSDQAKELSRDVRATTSEKAAWKVIEQWKEQTADAGRKTKTPANPGQRAVAVVVQTSRRLKPELFDPMTAHEREIAVKHLKQAVQSIQRTLAIIIAGLEEKKRA